MNKRAYFPTDEAVLIRWLLLHQRKLNQQGKDKRSLDKPGTRKARHKKIELQTGFTATGKGGMWIE